MYAEMRKVGHVKSVTSAYRGGFHGWPYASSKNSRQKFRRTPPGNEYYIRNIYKAVSERLLHEDDK